MRRWSRVMLRSWVIALVMLGGARTAAADGRPFAVTKQAARCVEEAPTTPSASAVARLYVDVGRRLRGLARGDVDTYDRILVRYRMIRVHDAMANPRLRRETVWELTQLARSISAARATAARAARRA